MSDESKCCDCSDEIIVGPEVSDGVKLYVRHTSDHTSDQIVCGVAKSVAHGQPLNGAEFAGAEFVGVSQIEGNRFSVTPIYKSGPVKVTSNKYRNGWDRIFGKTVGQA